MNEMIVDIILYTCSSLLAIYIVGPALERMYDKIRQKLIEKKNEKKYR